MFLMSRRSLLRGGLYHLSLLFVTFTAFEFGFRELTGVDLAGRIFAGASVPPQAIAIALCGASILVLWNNWVD
jgi:hypothetical protein